MMLVTTLFVCLPMLVAIVFCKNEDCPQIYQRFSPEHTYCITPNASCHILRKGVTEEEKRLILKLHNEQRNKVAVGKETRGGGLPPAANMLEMIWDDELAILAQKHSENCEFDYDCEDCRRVEKFAVYQMLGIHSTYRLSLDDADWKVFINDIFSTGKDFNKKYINPYTEEYSGGETSYVTFSQAMWANTWAIGCGWTLYKEGKEMVSLFTCNYGPKGNIEGEAMYKKGNPCSACPRNTCCGSKCSNYGITSEYEGLCKVIDENDSPDGGESKYIFYCDFHGQDDCSLSQSTDENWRLVKNRGGRWLSLVLEEGHKTVLKFNKPFRTPSSDGYFCFTLLARAGPNRAGDEIQHKAWNSFEHTSGKPEKEYFLADEDYQDFKKYEYSVGMFIDEDIQYSFNFVSVKGSQFVEIKSAYATPGKC